MLGVLHKQQGCRWEVANGLPMGCQLAAKTHLPCPSMPTAQMADRLAQADAFHFFGAAIILVIVFLVFTLFDPVSKAVWDFLQVGVNLLQHPTASKMCLIQGGGGGT